MREFVLASSNPHKIEEFSVLLNSDTVKITSPSKKIEVEETGTTFIENSLLKAKTYFEKFNLPAVADDSGLVVSALPNDLGVYSARFGAPSLDDEGRARLLLDKLAEEENRSAYFICQLCFYINPEEIFYFEGRLNGTIGKDYLGEDGFGYDPVFVPEGFKPDETLATMPIWKKDHSHRAIACSFANKFFK